MSALFQKKKLREENLNELKHFLRNQLKTFLLLLMKSTNHFRKFLLEVGS